MAKSGITKERAALEARRARLEATLNADANWRALRQFHAQGESEEGDERRAGDAKLELLLLANPTFRAWKQVDDAIEAMDKTEIEVDPPQPRGLGMSIPPLPLTSSNSPKEVASLADLSRGIARLIQRAPAGGDRGRRAAPAARESEETAPSVAHQAREPGTIAAEVYPEMEAEIVIVAEPDAEAGYGLTAEVASEAEVVVEAELVTEVAAEPEPDTELVVEAEAEPDVEIESEVEHEPAVALAVAPAEPVAGPAAPSAAAPTSHPKEKQSERPADLPWMVASERVRDEAPLDDGAGDDSAEDSSAGAEEEASVTFVARDLPASRSATTPSREHDLAATEDAGDVSYPLGADIEEAEVAILKSNQIEERRRTAQRDGNLRRFRRALLGD